LQQSSDHLLSDKTAAKAAWEDHRSASRVDLVRQTAGATRGRFRPHRTLMSEKTTNRAFRRGHQPSTRKASLSRAKETE
jgi:hypothetical protein